MRVGYMRVTTSTGRQHLEAERAAFDRLGCERIFADIDEGVKSDRAGLMAALELLDGNGTLVVRRLEHLGYSAVDVLKTVRDIHGRGLTLEAENVGLNTAESHGALVVGVMSSLAEWEHETIRARTRQGLERARKQGRVGGRPRALSSEQEQSALAALRDGASVSEVAREHNVSRWTISRLRDERRVHG